MAIMGLIIGTGFFASYIVEEGIKCLASIDLYWIIIGGLYALALVLLLICWIYLICLQDKIVEESEFSEETS